MRILVITYYYYPDLTPRAFRWTEICEQWAKLGHDVHIVTAYQQGLARTENKQGVSIHRAGGAGLKGFRAWVNGDKTRSKMGRASEQSFFDKSDVKTRHRTGWMKRLFRVIHDLTWRKIYWPDATCFWIWSAWRNSRKLCYERSFDVLITVSHPFSGHVVGLRLKQACPSILWLADNGDPFCFQERPAANNIRLYRKLNYWIEKRLLNSVDHFTVTTEGTAKIYQRLFPESLQKISVIPPLLQDAFLRTRSNRRDLFDSDAIILLFVGIFYSDIRNPRSLLTLIERLIKRSPLLRAKLQLHIIGSRKVIAEELEGFRSLQGRVLLHGMLPHDMAVNAMHQSDCLINIGNRTSFQLPSKVIEYMATGKSILNLHSVEGDSSAKVLCDYPYHLNTRAGQYDDVDSIIQFVEQSSKKVLSREDTRQRVMGFLSQPISDKYLSLILGQDQINKSSSSYESLPAQ